MPRPLSVENRWDILYRDYPEVYDDFSKIPYHPDIRDALPGLVRLQGKVVADIGSGSGVSSLALARHARRVIAIEIESAMQRVAKARAAGAGRVSFVAGDALALPLANASIDLAVGVTLALYPPEQYRGFIREGLRAAREQVLYVGIPPGWYGGDVGRAVGLRDEDLALVDRIFIEEFNFSYQDVDSLQEYGSLERIVNTYGFIFGRRAIDYLREEQKTSILWKFRVYSKDIAQLSEVFRYGGRWE
jgi:SAM-dependent methyltransferase